MAEAGNRPKGSYFARRIWHGPTVTFVQLHGTGT